MTIKYNQFCSLNLFFDFLYNAWQPKRLMAYIVNIKNNPEYGGGVRKDKKVKSKKNINHTILDQTNKFFKAFLIN